MFSFSKKHLEILQRVAKECPRSDFFFEDPSEELHAEIGLSKELTRYRIEELRDQGFLRELKVMCTSDEFPVGMTTKGYAAAKSPKHFLSQFVSAPEVTSWYGDYIAGDKVMNDKVEGDKFVSQNNFNGPTTGINGSNFHDNAQVTGNTCQQFNNPDAAELLEFIVMLRQTASQFPQEIRDELAVDIDEVETEIKKPESERNPIRLKKRLLALVTASKLIATPIVGMTDFANTAFDLANKIGIELPLP